MWLRVQLSMAFEAPLVWRSAWLAAVAGAELSQASVFAFAHDEVWTVRLEGRTWAHVGVATGRRRMSPSDGRGTVVKVTAPVGAPVEGDVLL